MLTENALLVQCASEGLRSKWLVRDQPPSVHYPIAATRQPPPGSCQSSAVFSAEQKEVPSSSRIYVPPPPTASPIAWTLQECLGPEVDCAHNNRLPN